MTWAVVARKDFQDARLSKALWTLTALFVLMSAGMAYLYATVPELSGDGVTTTGLLFMLGAPATLFIAIASIVVAVTSIAGERDSGSAKLLLGLPHSRRDVVVGKLVGRSAVLAVAILVGLAVTLGVLSMVYGSISLVDYVAFTGLTLLLALAYVGIMVGISALAGTSGRAMAVGLGAFVALEFLADLVPLGAAFVRNGFSMQGLTTMSPGIEFLGVVTPTAAYQHAIGWFLGNLPAAGPTPFYLTGWMSLLLLGAWLVVPLAIGYRHLRAADL
ncbi:ABC transporter permease subunit [Halorientalis salina]|uniref:ABC transporter permease subunit n=1 Tax=Halorientalis salina TaxID=2932266 RepID=UPI0010AC830B|nr:ABC transporter permease subunit [Halorientalis salina]